MHSFMPSFTADSDYTIDGDVRGIETYFLCIFIDNSVNYVHYRVIIQYHRDLYEEYYNYA